MKISKEKFIHILRKNGGIYSHAAREISDKIGLKYSRQSVKERANKLSVDIMDDIEGENLDDAQSELFNLMKSQDERVRLDAIKFYLKTKGKHLGFTEKLEVEQTNSRPVIQFINVSKLNAINGDQINNGILEDSEID